MEISAENVAAKDLTPTDECGNCGVDGVVDETLDQSVNAAVDKTMSTNGSSTLSAFTHQLYL